MERLRIPPGWKYYFSTSDCIKFNVEPMARETTDWWGAREQFFDLLQSYVPIPHMDTWWDFMKRGTITDILVNEWEAMKNQSYRLLTGDINPVGITRVIVQRGAHCAQRPPGGSRENRGLGGPRPPGEPPEIR